MSEAGFSIRPQQDVDLTESTGVVVDINQPVVSSPESIPPGGPTIRPEKPAQAPEEEQQGKKL
jgi:hypothetical protein